MKKIDVKKPPLFEGDIEKLFEKIGKMFEDIVVDDSAPITPFSFTNDHLTISIKEYLKRIVFYFKVSYSTLIIALIYLDSLYNKKGIKIHEKNIHLLLLITIVLAVKYNQDDNKANAIYARFIGISLEKINSLESIFLRFMDYKLYVNDKLYKLYLNNLNS